LDFKKVFGRGKVIQSFVRPDIVPDIFPLLNLSLHYFKNRTDIALLVELSFISPLGDLYIGILFGSSGIDKVMGNPFYRLAT